ncbi:MAG: hypothetical protein HKN26_15700 [Acidimicrobiales bacterium]|nr:hypothetical protein [Acidimicrobiales bacterium]
MLADLPAGVLITWNGGGFDFPFLADRARLHGIDLGLRMRLDPSIAKREPLNGHDGHYRATWYHHRHLDGYLVYRADVGASLHLSCALKAVARLVGIPAISVDVERIHLLDRDQLRAYVASDAWVARALVERRWANAQAAIDRPEFVLWGTGAAPAAPSRPAEPVAPAGGVSP